MLAPGTVFGHYRIDQMLGAGSMGVVYKAWDTQLDRVVALKLLDSELSKSADYQSRISLEAEAASQIDSPRVVKVWEHAQLEGQSYISLEFVSGEDLRTAAEKCDFSQKLELARQIADGVMAIHARGFLHRDLKPENIKLTEEGHVKILDFGLAKTVNADSVDEYGNVEGTLYYLSPEQITGEPISFPSDIFSYGVVLYEMFTGRRPFEGEYSSAIIYSILHEDPQPPCQINKELPDWLGFLIMKSLAKHQADRFEDAQSILNYIDDCLKHRIPAAAGPCVKLRQTVTVIDLKNLSGDESWEYFCVGFTDDLINELSRHTDLIISAEPSSSYERNIREVFKHYRSDFVIAGSLMKWQNRIRLHISVYGDGGENLVLGKNYETEDSGIFATLAEAVHDISTKLAEVTGLGAVDVEDYFETNIAAYEYYLKGKNYYSTNKPEDLQIAKKMFEKALEIDASLALAHSGLSDVYAFEYMAYYDRTEKKIGLAREEALKAIKSSPELPEAHRSLGRYYMFAGDFNNAEKSYLKAVELNPKYAIGYRTLSWLKELAGDHEKATYWAKMSLKFAPNDPETLLLLSLININLKKYTLAMATLHRAVELAPDYGRAYYNLGTVYLKLGVLDLALENLFFAIKYKGDPNAASAAGYILMVYKQYEKARAKMLESIAEGYFPFIAYYFIGFMEKLEGRSDAAAGNFRESLKIAQEYQQRDKSNPHIKAYQAMAMAALGDSENTLLILRELESETDGNGDILHNVARAYSLLGNEAKARELLQRAVTAHLGPTEKEINLDPHFAGYQLNFNDKT